MCTAYYTCISFMLCSFGISTEACMHEHLHAGAFIQIDDTYILFKISNIHSNEIKHLQII